MTSKKLTIVHLVNFLSPAGKEVGIVKLVNALDESKFSSILIVLDRAFDTLKLDQNKTKLIELKKGEGNDFSLIKKLKKIFREERVDIVHTHSWGTLVEGILAAKIARVPVVLHGEHGTFHRDFKRRIVQRLFFSLTDQVLSVSALLADDISRQIGIKREKIYTILNGVDVKRFSPDAEKRDYYRRKLNVSDSDIIIGTVGRPMKVKNHRLMILALKRLKEKGYPVRFAIVGDTPKFSLRAELESLAKKLKVSDFVDFLGFQSDIPGFLNSFDIFVLPSLSEGCSNVIQEAMATGLPVVASNVGGNPELITHNFDGILFASDSVDELVHALIGLMENPQKAKKLAQNALKTAREKFALRKMVENYQNLYLTMFEKKAETNSGLKE
ncbi:MAG: glycosyltransferase family 4 protein [Calditrichaeota bacterium]|nr:glycosyltransferase family 4 protein [Calditrichota bacterium]